MSKRKSRFATPGINPRNAPFTPSSTQEQKNLRAAKARELNRFGVRGVRARDIAID